MVEGRKSEVGVVGRGCIPGGIQAGKTARRPHRGGLHPIQKPRNDQRPLRGRGELRLVGGPWRQATRFGCRPGVHPRRRSKIRSRTETQRARRIFRKNQPHPTLKRVLRTGLVRSPAFRLGPCGSLEGNRGLCRRQRNGLFSAMPNTSKGGDQRAGKFPRRWVR